MEALTIQVAGESHGHVFEHPRLHEGFGSSTFFLGGLEDQSDGCWKIPFTSQKLGRTQEYAGVSIVSTGMHHAVVGRGERQPGLLLDGQGVDVGTQSHSVQIIAAGKVGHYPRAHETSLWDFQLVQGSADPFSGLVFLPAQLGVAMQIAANRDHALHHRRLHGLSHGSPS